MAFENFLIVFVFLCLFLEGNGSGTHQFAKQRASKYRLTAVSQFTRNHIPIPTLSTKQDRNLHKEETTFHLRLHSNEEANDSTEWLLDLSLNLDLVSSNFRFYADDVPHSSYEHCYYHGYIRGVLESSVSLSTCDNGLRGYVFDGSDLHHLDHVEEGAEHFLYRTEDSLGGMGTCEVEGESQEISGEIGKDFGQQLLKRNRRDQANKFVELFLAMDNTHYQLTGSNSSYSRQYAIEIANHMDFIYRSIGIRIALIGAEVWSTNDFISTSPDLSILLPNWIRYLPTLASRKAADGIAFDNAQLITGLPNSQSNVIGRAPLNSMCLSGSGGVNRDTRGNLATNIAATMSHEMGHNFGMNHDDGRSCNDCSDQRGCVMGAVINNPPPFLFTTCSTEDLTAALSSGVGSCIYNAPSRLFTDPFCGNAFVEEGEECDCGSLADCPTIDPCCEPGQCKLKESAQCGSGDCCDNCTFRGQDFTCRARSGDCDIEEKCSGDNSICPNNLYLRNGLSCTSRGVGSFCYDGACRTLLDQCRYVWGPSARVGRDICFNEVNVLGNEFGNCGQEQGVFQPCALENVKCGKLHCDVPENSSPVLPGSYRQTRYTFSGAVCTAISIDSGDMPDPGIVPDGTQCDASSVCLMGICTNVTELPFTPCPTDSSGVECPGMGECSNIGVCVGGNVTVTDGGAANNATVVVVVIVIVVFLLFLAFSVGGLLIGYFAYKKSIDANYKFNKPATSAGPRDRTSSFVDTALGKLGSLPRYGELSEAPNPVNTSRASRPPIPRNKPSAEKLITPSAPSRTPPSKPVPPLAPKPRF